MQLSQINPYVRVAMESKLPANGHISRRVLYDYELIYLERGEFTLVYDDIPYLCSAGDILLLRPGIAHSFLLNRGEISQPHIHFDLTHRPQSEQIPVSFLDVDQMTEEERAWICEDAFAAYPTVPFLTIRDKDEFLNCFYQIVRKSEQNSPLLRKAGLTRLIALLVADNFPQSVTEQPDLCIAQQIKDYLDAGNGMGMCLDDLADTFFYNKFYLEKKFKETFGSGIIEYRNQKRMEIARTLLRTHSVSKTAELVGYQSIYSFSRAYKTHFGIAPVKQKA